MGELELEELTSVKAYIEDVSTARNNRRKYRVEYEDGTTRKMYLDIITLHPTKNLSGNLLEVDEVQEFIKQNNLVVAERGRQIALVKKEDLEKEPEEIEPV